MGGMAGKLRRFPRGSHDRSSPGQRHASVRKRKKQELRYKADQADREEAARRGVSVVQIKLERRKAQEQIDLAKQREAEKEELRRNSEARKEAAIELQRLGIRLSF